MIEISLSRVEALIKEFSFNRWGWARLTQPVTMDAYDRWIEQGYHGEMEYLSRHSQKKRHPQSWMPEARTALVVSRKYFPHDASKMFSNDIKIAKYARLNDYHNWFHDELLNLGKRLQTLYSGLEFRVFTDASPVLERDLAFRAGLGWVGKNTCLIDKEEGSYFFIGGLYTNIDNTPPATPSPDHCGRCNRCVEACPTSAIKPNRVLDARLCISYWTIESKSVAPLELRSQFGKWLFGCDICQEVCPWNRTQRAEGIDAGQKQFDLRYFLSAETEQINEDFKDSPLLRRKAKGLKMNALIVAGNEKRDDLISLIHANRADTEFKELADWALHQLNDSQQSVTFLAKSDKT